MKRFFKVLAAAWLTGAVMGGGCFCGAAATGIIAPKRGQSPDVALIQAQIVEIQSALESFTPYDQFAANPIDEMAGLE